MTLRADRSDGRSRRHLPLIVLVLMAAATPAAWAQDKSKPTKLFDSEGTLALTLNAPWRTVTRDKGSSDSYPARMEYRDESGTMITLDLTVERRGITRQRVCAFPPIRLRFEKDVVKGTAFRGQKSLKMVTHCERSSRYDQYVLLEMLTYRMYNLLTEASFRVRPLEVSYVDSDGGKEVDRRFAFLIEDDSDVARRNDMKKLDVGKIRVSSLQAERTGLMALYQYMIGNVDWAATAGPEPDECCHNIKLIAPDPHESSGFVTPLPYDFDSAGLIDAPYAVPAEGLPIKKVTQRLYRGYCRHNDTLPEARQVLREKKNEFLALIEDESRLDSRSARNAVRYIEGYFEIDGDEGKFDRYVIERCRK